MGQEQKISVALSFVSGFVDTAGFVALFGLFTAHVTGNLVLAGAAVFEYQEMNNLTSKLLVLPVFVAGVVLCSYLIKYRRATLSNLVLSEAIFIFCFSIAGAIFVDKTAMPSNTVISFVASFAVIGMSIQNTYMRKLLNHYTPNTVMTGNFTQFSIDLFNLADHYINRQANKDEMSQRLSIGSLKKVGLALLGFLGGCGVGALLVNSIGLRCCLLPAFILLWVRKQLEPPVIYKAN